MCWAHVPVSCGGGWAKTAARLSFIFIHLLASGKQSQGVAPGSDWLSGSVGLHDGNAPEGKAGAISLWHAVVRDHC